MPKLPDAPQVIRLRWIGTEQASQPIGSHLTFRYAGSAPSSAQLAAIAPAWGTSWATNMAPLVDTGYTLSTLEVIDLSSSTAGVAESAQTHPGTRAGAFPPLNVCVTVQALTNLRRRGGHWHAQVRAGVQTDFANTQSWNAAFITAFQTGWNAWIAGIQANLWSGATSLVPVAVQYYGPPNRTVTNASGRVKTVSTLLPVPNVYPINSFQAKTRLGSQRRRLG